MLYRELPQIESNPLDGWGRWLVPALAGAAGITFALLLLLLRQPVLAGLALVAGAAAATIIQLRSPKRTGPAEPLVVGPDYSLVGSALGLSREPCALTNTAGSLLIANAAYRERFGGSTAPLDLGVDEEAREGLNLARSLAGRDGTGCVAGIATSAGACPVEVDRAGLSAEFLLWRFPAEAPPDPLSGAVKRIQGKIGERLASAGVLAAVVDAKGKLLAANRPFLDRAVAPHDKPRTIRFADLVEIGDAEQMRLVAEGEAGRPLRAVHVPSDPDGDSGAGTFLLFGDASAGAQGSNLQALLDVLPIGLALADRDGRFLTMNKAFRQAAGLDEATSPVYPGDLVVKEDKAAVADAVRRNARGPAMSGDLAVRLARQQGDPVALTIAGLRGLGDAAVLLLLKDNSEEAKLKRQVAQATKMQVVGQLAGGVAHDFNNILTAIIGHCDLILMRHTPGDSDYDDIQQIKSNSNRAAGLTRQLLAFSRQQTLRPQVVQLPDVVSEVSHLLKRLLGETVELVVKHGRNLGPVRADPGQLEQVIINLAVNARDAMAEKGGGALTIQSYSVRADQVAELGSDILPISDYSALSVTDTGCGIPSHVLGKVFEPFFTTKEVGKGTGLGLSMVYGMARQSGGAARIESRVGEGTAVKLLFRKADGDIATEPDRGDTDQDEAEPERPAASVLVIDDDPDVRGFIADTLEEQGYRVRQASDGRQGLAEIQRETPDLVIVDFIMPGLSGADVAKKIRAKLPGQPILFVSGYSETEAVKRTAPDAPLLTKPFRADALQKAVRRAIGS
jgi:two-component system, cell cycle sensor histidine kinase and response regulator CckA